MACGNVDSGLKETVHIIDQLIFAWRRFFPHKNLKHIFFAAVSVSLWGSLQINRWYLYVICLPEYKDKQEAGEWDGWHWAFMPKHPRRKKMPNTTLHCEESEQSSSS